MVAIKSEDRDLRRELRKLRKTTGISRGADSTVIKDFEELNKTQILTTAQRFESITQHAVEHKERCRRVLEQAAVREDAAHGMLQAQIAHRHQAKASRELQHVQRGLLLHTSLMSRVSVMSEALCAARHLSNLTMKQAVAVVCVQRRWRFYLFSKAMRRRVAARKVMISAVTHWVRRLRLKWRRGHTKLLLSFLHHNRQVQTSFKTAVSRYIHLVILVQRRFRAYRAMWRERMCLARLQFNQTAIVMASQSHHGVSVLNTNLTLILGSGAKDVQFSRSSSQLKSDKNRERACRCAGADHTSGPE